MAANATRNTLIWGLVFLLAGAAGIYVFGYLPWRDGFNHEPKVTLSLKGLGVSAVFALLGILMLLPIGPAPVPVPGMHGQLPIQWRKLIFIAVFLLVVIGTIAYYFWLRTLLRGQGYEL